MNKATTSILALILAALGVLVAGALTGALAGLLSDILYIIFLFPSGMGILGALLLEKTMTQSKIKVATEGILRPQETADLLYRS